jgi:beta-glucosidase
MLTINPTTILVNWKIVYSMKVKLMNPLLKSTNLKGVMLLVIGTFYSFAVFAQQYPFQNPEYSSEERAKDLISRLSIEEKATLMCDQSDAIPRLGIKKFNWWSEALHGYANNDSVTVFPEPIGMAASFNDELLFNIYDAVSDEARAKYHQWLNRGNENKRFLSLSVWTPNVNIFRDPRWGRGQETYGEDPYLASRMGVQVVKGLQGPADAKYRKLLACAKHYAVHSGPEWSRHELNLNNVNPREFQETYLPAFKALVQEADVRQVMCAYQRLDDEPCCGSTRLLQKILRDEWGFKHIVVSDCGAITDFYTTHKVSSTPVHAASKGVLAGTDVECVWENYPYKTLPEGVDKGLIKEEDIDKSLMRVLIGRFDLGDFDDDAIVPWAQIPASTLNNDKHRKLALEMALQTMTLLQNNNNILPLSKSAKKVAIIGPNADDKVMLWGNYNGTPIRTISILDGIKTKLSENKILYDKGCDLVEDKVTESYFGQLSFEGKQGFKATYWNNPDRKGDKVTTVQITNPIKMTTAGQHEFASGVKLEGFSALFETEFTPKITEELVFKGGATGYFELIVNGDTIQSYSNWRTLSSRTPFKVEAGNRYKIEIRYAQLNNWQANIEFNFGKEVDVDYTELVNKLKGIETVVFVGGLSGNLEGEEMPVSYPGFKGGDRTNIELPAVQRNCLKALKAAGKKVVFVNCSGSAIALTPETESCDAILQAWYAGESGGQAVADVLFGDYNPSGKLPITFYKNSDNLGDFEDYSMKGRTYRYSNDYLFPFGFGLSYTNFEIGDATPGKTVIKANETISITVPVKNTGKRTGTEIVQVYVRKVNDLEGPLKTLRGFQRVEVPAGKTSIATINLSPSSFEFYDWSQREMSVTTGEYEVFYGNSSDDKDLKHFSVIIE